MVPLGHKCPVSDNDAQRLWAPSLAKAGATLSTLVRTNLTVR